jgi:hypothetical protein
MPGTSSDDIWEAAADSGIDDWVQLVRPRGQVRLAAAIIAEALAQVVEHPYVLPEAGDLERCVAWAIIDQELARPT